VTPPAAAAAAAPEVAAAARLAPLRVLVAGARQHPVWAAFAVGVLASIGYLALWDDKEVQKAVRDWSEAAKFLSDAQFGASLNAVLPKDEDWTFKDREAFDKSILHLNQEIDAIIKALDANQEALKQVAEKYRDAIDGLIDTLTPILLMVIFGIYLTRIPHTVALGTAIGLAGATATVFIFTELWNNLGTLFSAVAALVRSSGVATFVNESRPGWADPEKPDPNISDIKIDYNLDPSAYRK
jgi:hypothetical protein